MLTEKLLGFALLGAEWVLWLLVGLSVASVGVVIERALYFMTRQRIDGDGVYGRVLHDLDKGDFQAAENFLADHTAMEAVVAHAGLKSRELGPSAASEVMAGTISREKSRMNRFLALLATVGSNAPYIGLFGTVLGIMKAFADLAADESNAGAKVVMAGISEALVATAVGLLVAIPAVISFNYFKNRIQASAARTDTLARLVLSRLEGGKGSEGG